MTERERRAAWAMCNDLRDGPRHMNWWLDRWNRGTIGHAMAQLRAKGAPLVYERAANLWHMSRPWAMPLCFWPREQLESHIANLTLDALLGPLP